MPRGKLRPTLEEVKALLAADRDFLRPVVEAVLQELLEAEMTDALGAEKGERTPARLGHRSGYYGHTLVTRVGKLELRVPQDRQGRFSTELFECYQRSEKALMAALAEMYVQGVSTRKVKAITEELCGHSFSAATATMTQIAEDSGHNYQRSIRWHRNQAPVPVGELEHRRSYSLAFVRHHAEPASPGEWWWDRLDHVVRRDRERYDLVDARRDLATGAPRAVRGRLLACLQHSGGDQHQCPVRHLPLGLGLLDVAGLQWRHRAHRMLRLLLDPCHGAALARRSVRLPASVERPAGAHGQRATHHAALDRHRRGHLPHGVALAAQASDGM